NNRASAHPWPRAGATLEAEMGTRHLIGVVSGGVFKIAQYGQWDGYPEGQGATVLGFLAGLGGDLSKFREAVNNCRFMDEDETDNLGDDWQETHPQLSRDLGGKILNHVLARGGCPLFDASAFGADSLICEWAYIIDLDAETLEFYDGFQTAPHGTGRWGEAPGVIPYKGCKSTYYGVRLLKVYPLAELPTVADLQKDAGEEEEEA
ncbi:hypothetical protein KDK88_04895, partial [bacterium]|nr:hypothetical protein [bacterium]